MTITRVSNTLKVRHTDTEGTKLARSFAEKLGRLFDEVRGPGGRRWENREVVEAINASGEARISASYLSELLSGKKDNPNIWTVKALADFFGQSVVYFVDDDRAPAGPDNPLAHTQGNTPTDVTTVAERLDLVFKMGREPSIAQVAAEVANHIEGFTVSRLARLRDGRDVDMTEPEAAAVAAFFHVPLAVLTDPQVAELVAASLPAMTLMGDETVRKIAFRAHSLSARDQAIVAGLLDRLSNIDPGMTADELDF